MAGGQSSINKLRVALEGYEPGSDDDFAARVNSNHLRATESAEGRTLKFKEIEEKVTNLLTKKGYPKDVIANLFGSQIGPYFDAIRDLLQLKKQPGSDKRAIDDEIKGYYDGIDSIIKTAVNEPQFFGYNPDNFNKKPSDQEFSMTAEDLQSLLDGFELDENGYMPFEAYNTFLVEGRLLPSNKIRQVCEESIKKAVPEAEANEMKVIINNCIDPLLRRADGARDPYNRYRNLLDLASVMHDICSRDKLNGYIELIVDGKTNEELQLVPPHLVLRPPLTVRKSVEGKDRPARNHIMRNWYRSLVAAYDAEKLGNLEKLYKQALATNQEKGKKKKGSPRTFFDEAGFKSLIQVTEEIDALLRKVGYSEENDNNEIKDAYAGGFAEILQNIGNLNGEIAKLRRSGQAKSNDMTLLLRSREKAHRDLVFAVATRLDDPAFRMFLDKGKSKERTAIGFSMDEIDTGDDVEETDLDQEDVDEDQS